MRPILRWALPAIAVVPLLSGCAALSAKGKPTDLPSLNVPPPPPRLIEAAPEPLPEPVAELPTAPPSTTALRGTTRPPVTRPNPPQPESKPADPKPVEPPPPDPAPVAQPSAIAPAAQLRTPQTADTSNAEKGVRTTLDRARGLLTTVNYGSLTNERKKAYDDSNRFIQQADAALKEGNFVFAQSLAGKAETLAKELAGK